MKHLLFLMASMIVYGQSFSQLPLDRPYGAITFKAKKDGSKFTLQADNEAIKASARNEPNPYVFFYTNVLARLKTLIGADETQLSNIEAFAIRFAKDATTPVPQAGRVRSIVMDKFTIAEFRTTAGTFRYTKMDTLGNAMPVDFFYKVGNRYEYNSAVLNGDQFLKSNIAAIQNFIKTNDAVAVPSVEPNISAAGSDELFIKYGDGTSVRILVTAEQIKFFKEKTGSGKTSAVNNPSTSATVKAPEKKSPVRLLDPQLIACAGKTSFELTAFTYPGAEADSMQIEINTKTVKILDSVHQKIGLVEFKRLISDEGEIKKLSCADSIMSPSLDIFHAKLSEAWKAKKKEDELKSLIDTTKKFLAAFRDSVGDRISKLANEKGFAARLELKDSMIPLNISCKDKHQEQNKIGEVMLKLDSIVIQVNNNLIYQIDIVGRIGDKRIQTVSNNQYGLALRELIDWSSSITFTEGGKEYYVCYRNLVFVRPADGEAINYTIADGTYTLVPKKQPSQLLAQKPLLDFISASVFLDLQAFNEKNPNKNLLTEVYFNFNINNHRFWQKFSWFRYLYTNLTLATNLFKEANTLPTYRNKELAFRDSTRIDTATAAPFYKYDSLFNNKYYLKHFDLVKYSFLQVKPTLNVLSIDYKEARTFFEINAGLMLMGSNVRTIDPGLGRDSITSAPIFSYSPLYEIRGRITPKPRFGIDMHLVYVPKLRLLNTSYESITGLYDAETLVKAKMINENKSGFIQGEINFFFNPKESPSPTDRGGLYFKLNMFKATQKPDGFFMFLVGYSTDIKNFFK